MPKCPSCQLYFTSNGRSIPQNSAYWKLIVQPLAEHLGLKNDECHEILKYKFNSEILMTPKRGGHVEEIRRIKSTTVMTTTEFNEFCAQIRIWASQLEPSCYLQEPNEPPIEK